MAPSLLRAAALVLRTSSTVCPAQPTCPQDDQCTYDSNGVSLQVSCATDFYGGDMQFARTSSLASCMNACASTTGCVAISYVSQNCYLKSQLNAAQANTGVIGASVITRNPATPSPGGSASACPATYTCPENNGCTVEGLGGRAFTLSCSTDYYGGDLTNLWVPQLSACTEACATNPQCIAASFTGGSGAGQCYLKDTKNSASFNDNVDAIAVVAPAVVPSSSIASTSSSSVASSSSSSSTSSDISTSTSSSTSSSTPSPPTPTTTSSSTSTPSSTSASSTPSSTSTPTPSTTPTPSSSTTVDPSTSTSSTSTPTPSPILYAPCSTLTGCTEGRICSANNINYKQSCDGNFTNGSGDLAAPQKSLPNPASTRSTTNNIPGSIFAACADYCQASPGCNSFLMYQDYMTSSAWCFPFRNGQGKNPQSPLRKFTLFNVVP